MSDVLAIAGDLADEELVDRVARWHPSRVTVLLDTGGDPIPDDSPDASAGSDRLAHLLGVIETRTGATVIGVAGSRAQLRGWRFDHEVGAELVVA